MGPQVCAWLETFLVHGPGDVQGSPYRLHPWAEDLLNRWFELKPDGTFRYDRGLVGLPKGNSKTEAVAAVSVAELAGPVAFNGWDGDGGPRPGKPRTSPDIPVCASSFEQAGRLFEAAKAMVQAGPLAEYLDVWENEITVKGRPGRLYRVPCAAGVVDGARPTLIAIDELHEITGTKERVVTVLEAGCAKRGGRSLAITTAGWDPTSLLGKRYAHGKRVEAGEVKDDGFLFIWHEASPHWNLADPAQLDAAIREANPAIGRGGWLSVENVVRQFNAMAPHDGRRYFLNQFVERPTTWCPGELWAGAARPERTVASGTQVVLGFDGSYNRDATALIGCTVEDVPHLFVVGIWERPLQAPADWVVPRADVLASIAQACATYQVSLLGFDDSFARAWSLDMATLQEKGVAVTEWPTRTLPRMGPASGAFLGALRDGRLTHDGNAQLTAHVSHCVAKGTRWGLVPVKESQDSVRRIDAGVASVLAYALALAAQAEGQSGWNFATFELPNLHDGGPEPSDDGFVPIGYLR